MVTTNVPEPTPTVPQRIAAAATSRQAQEVAGLILAAAAVALAPVPFGSIGAAAVALLAWRRR